MDFNDFKAYVDSRPDAFTGVRPETRERIEAFEKQLSVSLPEALKWLLIERGYSGGCGIGSLDGSVADTQRFRKAVNLPHRYWVLADNDDAGVVLLDTASDAGRVVWIAIHDVYNIAECEPIERDVFPDYLAWVKYCVTVEDEFAA